MILTVNASGFITGYCTYSDLQSNNISRILNLDKKIESPDFPVDQSEAWQHFQNHYRCYTFHEVPPEYWKENFGDDYEIPSADIVSQFVYHEEHEEVLIEEQRDVIRARRELECFTIINRGEAWYALLTEQQKSELQTWYQAWLDAPETLVVPEKLEWLK